ncbi:MAG: galactose/methyl galactoside ABC transporter permease MglC [Bacillota bacterium]|nr:galactose/methyl galactoside ABC transporter permease MglC [Bacillota bacterium]
MNKLNVKIVINFLFKNAIYVVLVILVGILAILNPNFLSINCLRDILLQCSPRAIIALGAAFVLITGGTDLSAGRVVGLTAVLSASMLQTAEYARRFYPDLPQLPLWLPILLAVLAGLTIGLINGLIVSKFSVPPFIATLGTMVIVLGINTQYFDIHPNDSQPIAGLRKDFTYLGSGYFFNIPVIIIIAVIISIIVWIIFNKTIIGKNMYAIGANKEAAKVSGINVGRNLLIIYAIAGALYAIAGSLVAARSGGATNRYGEMYELDAIAACVVGGVSTTGGVGTVPGVLAGVVIFEVINYGLTFIEVKPSWQLVIKGAIIVVAVAFDIRKYLAKK